MAGRTGDGAPRTDDADSGTTFASSARTTDVPTTVSPDLAEPVLAPLSGPGVDDDVRDEPGFRLDPDTMTAAVREQWMPLVRLATLLLNDRALAEEVVQSACEAVWRRRPDVAGSGQLIAYLRTSVVNGAHSAARRRGTAARYLAQVRIEDELPADAELLLGEDRRQLRGAVSRLPLRQREVVVLRYWSRLSEVDIARTLGISTGTVKSTAHHALAALRRHLEGRP